MFYKQIIRSILFRFQPETAHAITFNLLKISSLVPFLPALMRRRFASRETQLHRRVFGIDFPNPVGLAAGLDKDAEVFDMLGNLGFGFVEIGTLTPKPQPGNPKPRLFRLKKDQALINRMGFNNKGVAAAVKRLKRKKTKVIIGGNIGKNKHTPNEQAVEDYKLCFNELYPYVDYFAVNVSSPNTPNLRALQDKKPLQNLLMELKKLNREKPKEKPILLKIAPDLTNEQLDDIVEIVQASRIDGIIATNTTISRKGLIYRQEEIEKLGAGGLSGKPLRKRSTEIIRYLSEKTAGKLPIIGVGGIHSAADALEKLEAGASLLQLYTGFIYEGVSLISAINKALKRKL